jgi:hypothetical protein
MAIQTINIGQIANDGTGDDLRVAFAKINSNFTDVDSRVAIAVDAENLGSGEGIFYVKDSNTLQFKSLVAGDNINLNATANDITISVPDSIRNIQFNADTGNLLFDGTTAVNIQGGQNIDTSFSSSILTIDINGTDLVFQDPSPTLNGVLNAATNDINNVNILTVNTVTANTLITAPNYQGNVYGIDLRFYEQALGRTLFGVDYGGFEIEATSGIDLLIATASVDYGTFTAPAGLVSDYGTFTNPTI